MSGTIKNARWQLSYDRVAALGLTWEDISPDARQNILDSSQEQLTFMAENEISYLASRWTEREVEDLAPQRKALEAAIGYGLIPVSIAGHPDITHTFRTVKDRDDLVETILAAGFRKDLS
jgi:hypothetical protein